jgi:hypothetical protein
MQLNTEVMQSARHESPALTMQGSNPVRRGDLRQGVNLSDMPELMRGAQPGATASSRKAFKSRSVQLYQDGVSDSGQILRVGQSACVGPPLDVSDAVAMFPALDAGLVKSIFFEAQTPGKAVDTLLTLSRNIAELVSADVSSGTPRTLGVDDHDLFPLLVDADGWQVANIKEPVRHANGDGSAWRDRAKAAASVPVPPIKSARETTLKHPRSRPQAPKCIVDGVVNDDSQDNEYDWRQNAGVKRMQSRRKYRHPHRPNTSLADMQEVLSAPSL